MAAARPPADPLGPESIRAAAATIHPAFSGTPQFVHEGLSSRAGRTVVVKVETVNPIRAFKGRGTWHAIAGLVGEGTLGPKLPVDATTTGRSGPVCRVVGIQSDAAPSMTLSWEQGRPVETDTAATAAEGIATRVPVPEALAMMVGRVDAMRLVPEASLADAQAELTAELGITVEGAAAASWAGLLADADPPDGAALVIVTGSNVAR